FSGGFTFEGQSYSQVGSVDSATATDDVFVGALGLDGTKRWLHHLGSPGLERVVGMDVGLRGEVLLQGVNTWPLDFQGKHLGASGRFVAAFTSAGASLWARSLSSSKLDTVDVSVLSTGEVVVGGILEEGAATTLEDQRYVSRGRKDLIFFKLRP
ncbi:hypothetical protein HPC49_53745, partial [Pyxidicoccus fallax]